MTLIARLNPTNYLAEKEKFWADPTYNPQFQYPEPTTIEELQEFGLPEEKYLDLALEVLKKSYYGRNEQDLFMMEGPRMNQEQVNEKVEYFLRMHHLETKFEVVWSSSFISRASMTADTIKLRLPVDFHKEGLIGMIYHEIGTHGLRRINYEQQPWYKHKLKYGFADHLLTEEGLAVLHALIPHSFKSTFIGAIRYVAISYAQDHSFSELWQLLGKSIQDEERRWNVTFRAKRGLTDTSQPGGLTKDLVYFKGPFIVWQWLKARNYELKPLYFGKVACEDVDKAIALNPQFEPLLPSFYVTNPEEYARELEKIGTENMFDSIRIDS